MIIVTTLIDERSSIFLNYRRRQYVEKSSPFRNFFVGLPPMKVNTVHDECNRIETTKRFIIKITNYKIKTLSVTEQQRKSH